LPISFVCFSFDSKLSINATPTSTIGNHVIATRQSKKNLEMFQKTLVATLRSCVCWQGGCRIGFILKKAGCSNGARANKPSKMNQRLLCFIFVGLSGTPLPAQKYFDFSPRATDAYQKIFSLRFEEAYLVLDGLQKQEPDNLIRIFLENTLEVLRIGVDDDAVAYSRLSKNMEARLSRLSRGEPRSPYYRYTQAEIRLQWAVLHARFGHYLSSLSDIKIGYALLQENQQRFPDFMANYKSLGVLHVLVGNVPDDYRWAVRLFGGMQGDVRGGIAELESLLAYAENNTFLFQEEVLMAYSLLQLNLNNQPEKAWNTLKNSRLNPQDNALAAFVMGNIALKSGHCDAAIYILSGVPKGTAFYPFHYCDYLLGVAQLQRLDADADLPLLRFVANFKGENGLKEGYQKLAWHQLLQGKTAGYYHYMWQVKQQGNARSDPDKVALREANSGEIPDVRLLKARLLFDGGYYNRAFDLLKNNSADYDTNPRNKLEYQYRMGRIAQKSGKIDAAYHHYETTIRLGENQPWYFACNAALQIGILQEEAADYKNARYWYQKCLAINPEEYAGSLHGKAKAGLNRLPE